MNCRTWTTSVLASLLITWPASAMPDASTMKRLETVAFYLGAADHCRIKIETPRLEAYLNQSNALDAVTWGAITREARKGAIIQHQPGSDHCTQTERLLRAEGIID
ncbi:hypothetical protein [Stappia sp.]|uniref:hypothetical protein n=1 Tax=Stappia sp. TaxID=1870903 RepID=UPI003A98D392